MAQIAEELAGPEGLCARSSRADLRDAICGFATALPDGAQTTEIERWATRLVNDTDRFVTVVAPRGGRVR